MTVIVPPPIGGCNGIRMFEMADFADGSSV